MESAEEGGDTPRSPASRGALVAVLQELCPVIAACMHSPELMEEFVAGLRWDVRVHLHEFSHRLQKILGVQSPIGPPHGSAQSSDEDGEHDSLGRTLPFELDMMECDETRFFKDAFLGPPLCVQGVKGGLFNGCTETLEIYLDTHPDLEAFLTEALVNPDSTSSKYLRDANQLWLDAHPVDPEYPPHPCETSPPPAACEEERIDRILLLNLQLHSNEAEWKPLIEARTEFLNRLQYYLCLIEKKNLAPLAPKLQSAVWMLQNGIAIMSPHSTPYQLHQAMTFRIQSCVDTCNLFIKGLDIARKKRYGLGIWAKLLGSFRGKNGKNQPKNASDEEFDKLTDCHRTQANMLLNILVLFPPQLCALEPPTDTQTNTPRVGRSKAVG
ncbi:hypothetical protein DIPPA_12735 [Diplonema papillatum]|nr:hypothetical protein DIPPA_12735 [Diplonema papillatum]